jgi:hypothetical protein
MTRKLACNLVVAAILLALLPAVAAAQPRPKTLGKGNGPVENIAGPTGDLVYYPILPCRIFDSRPGTLPGHGTGPLAPGNAVAIQVTDAGTHLACGIPFPAAKAVMMNFIAVSPEAAGDLRAWAWDDTNTTPPNSSILNYSVVSGLNIANGVIVPICDTSISTGGNCDSDAFLRTDVGPSQVVIDALGYFAAPPVETPTCVVADTTDVLTAFETKVITGPTCPAGYFTVSGGFFTGTLGAVVATGSSPIVSGTYPIAANSWYCELTNDTNASVNVDCRALCCQVH